MGRNGAGGGGGLGGGGCKGGKGYGQATLHCGGKGGKESGAWALRAQPEGWGQPSPGWPQHPQAQGWGPRAQGGPLEQRLEPGGALQQGRRGRQQEPPGLWPVLGPGVARAPRWSGSLAGPPGRDCRGACSLGHGPGAPLAGYTGTGPCTRAVAGPAPAPTRAGRGAAGLPPREAGCSGACLTSGRPPLSPPLPPLPPDFATLITWPWSTSSSGLTGKDARNRTRRARR